MTEYDQFKFIRVELGWLAGTNCSVIQSFFHQSLKRINKSKKKAHTHKQDTFKKICSETSQSRPPAFNLLSRVCIMKKRNENLCIYGVSDGTSKHKAVRSRVAIMMVVPKQHYHSHNLLLCAQDTLQGQTTITLQT